MAEGAPNNLTLTILSGPLSGESFALEGAVGHVIMGSGESAHIQFESPVVVESHVRLAIDEQGAAVAPASPGAPVFLNDDPVTEDTPLKNGDILWMGNPGDDGAVMIQCRLEPVTPTDEVVEELEPAPVEAEMATAEEPPIEAEPEEAAFVESAEPIAEPDFVVEEAGLVAPTEAEGAFVAEAETTPESPGEPEAPAPEPMAVEESEAEVVEAAEVEPPPDDADQETVFLGAAEATPAMAEPTAEAVPEDAAPTSEPVPPPEPEAPAAEAPPPPEPPASPPVDDPQPWEEQPEDSVKAAWEVEQAPQPPPPPGREDLAKPEDAAAEPPPPPPAPTPRPPVRRPPPRAATRTSRPAARPAPPPAASSSGKMMGIAAGVVVLVGGAVAAFFMLGRGGSDPAPTPPPVTVAQTLAPPTTLSVTEELLDDHVPWTRQN